MSQTPTPETLQATRRAVARIRSYGVDGPRPIEEIEALMACEDELDAALDVVLRDASAEDLTAAIRLVYLMRRGAVIDTVRSVAFAAPSSVEAKREALAAMRRCDVEADADAIEKIAAIEALATAPDAEALADVLEWPPAWREPGLSAWLDAAGAEQLAAVEIALGIQPELDARLLDWIASHGSMEAATVLQRFLAGAQDKDRVKQVKKALHRLRSQGVHIEETAAAPQGGGFSLEIESGALQDGRAYATSVDGSGSRLVWVLWRAPSGGSRLLQAVLDDVNGVREAEVAKVTRQGFREYVEQMQENPTVLLQQVSLNDAAVILAAAAAHTEAVGGELPADFRTWSEVAGVVPAAVDTAPIYAHIGADEVRGDTALIDESMKLLREAHFQSWALGGSIIDAAADEIQQAETSTLMVSDEQRRERMQDAIRDAVAKSFDDDARGCYRGRLEVMAQMLWEGGQEEPARQALAAAVGFTEIDDLFTGHAFARALTHRGVWLAYEDKQREMNAEQQRSGIVQP